MLLGIFGIVRLVPGDGCKTVLMPSVDQRRRDILVLDDVFSREQLALLSAAVQSEQFEPQDLGRGQISRRERAVLDDDELAQMMRTQIGLHLPPIPDWFAGQGTPLLEPTIENWVAVGCNPRSRIYRYSMGAAFSEHRDEPWKPDADTRSMLTVLVYLPTGGCEGGETVIDGETVGVADGRVVVFDHGLLHEGKPVESGQKLVLRNDVVASAVGSNPQR